jgi:2-polyprenyl-6-methoxyphenol hydroxylase-like FAD-dependent oxidoreductase
MDGEGMRRTALIIGGGIGGLAAAVALRSIDFEVSVYERAPELHEVGAGLSLWANAVQALTHLGLAERVRALAIPDVGGGIYAPSGKRLVSVTNRELARRFGEYSVMIHRAELHGLLLDALAGARLELGKTFVGFESNAEGVRASFSDGSQAQADVLIGADGLHSAVRKQLHGEARPRYAGYTAWRSVVRFDQAGLLPGETWGRGARFGRIPMKDGRVYWFATKNAPEGARGQERAELLRTFGSWHAPIEALIGAADETGILRNDIYDRPVLKSWGEGRVTLLGDAAHPMTPNLGQGACQALEDAVVLARALAAEANVGSALRAYEAARKARTDAIVLQSRRLGRIAQLAHPLAVAIRDALLGKLPASLQTRGLKRVLHFEA